MAPASVRVSTGQRDCPPFAQPFCLRAASLHSVFHFRRPTTDTGRSAVRPNKGSGDVQVVFLGGGRPRGPFRSGATEEAALTPASNYLITVIDCVTTSTVAPPLSFSVNVIVPEPSLSPRISHETFELPPGTTDPTDCVGFCGFSSLSICPGDHVTVTVSPVAVAPVGGAHSPPKTTCTALIQNFRLSF